MGFSQQAPVPRSPRAANMRIATPNFVDKDLGKAISYGVYDVSTNTVWVAVGTDHETLSFVVASLLRWSETSGKTRYSDVDQLLICAENAPSHPRADRLNHHQYRTHGAVCSGHWRVPHRD